MNFDELLFFTQLIIFLGVLLYKLYRLMNINDIYMTKEDDSKKEIKTSILLTVTILFCWIIGFVLSILNYDNLAYLQLMSFQHWLLGLNILMLIGEWIYSFVIVPMNVIKPYGYEKKS